MARKVLPLPAPPRTSTMDETGGVKDDGLVLGECIGGIVVGQSAGDDVALW